MATGEDGGFAPIPETVETPMLSLGCLMPEVFASVLSPGLPGVYQVSFTVPETTPGGNHGFSLAIGGQTSNEVVLPVSGDAIPGVCAVVNAATFDADAPIAPGSIMSLFAMNIGEERELLDIFPDTEFNGVSVTFNPAFSI